MNARPGGLDCFEVLAHLSDYLDGALPASTRERVESHVGECLECARFGGSVARLVGALRALRAVDRPTATAPGREDVPAAVAARLDGVWRRELGS